MEEAISELNKNLQTFDYICSTIADHIPRHGLVDPENTFSICSYKISCMSYLDLLLVSFPFHFWRVRKVSFKVSFGKEWKCPRLTKPIKVFQIIFRTLYSIESL